MTDLARRRDGENTDPLTAPYADKLLPLFGNSPVTVLVKLVQTPAGIVPGFALADDGVIYTTGIQWNYPPQEDEYSLFITFQLATDVIELTCETLWYSVVQTSTQQMCVRTGEASYHFDVEIDEKVLGVIKVDPKIVVTPIISL